MVQHLNLLDASFERKREWLGSTGAIAALGATAVAAAGCVLGLQALTAQAQQRAADLDRQLVLLQARSAELARPQPAQAPHEPDEIERLRAAEAAQARILAALDSGGVGTRDGYSPYLLALSRQTRPQLWLTGFVVAADGRALTLAGRMTDPRRLPEYLRRLNEEPLFKGREFAQLSLKTPQETPDGEGGGSAEFVLRATPASGEPAR